MRRLPMFTAAAFVLVALPAAADVTWSGPGWYVESTETGFDVELVSGPYSTEDECKAALPADTEDESYDCEYDDSDPDAGGS